MNAPRFRVTVAVVRRTATLLIAAVFVFGGAALASATGWGAGDGKPAHPKYQQLKPGCGPDKTDGVAGGSGRHVGQPPKDQNRGDCPNPPGHN